MDRLTVAHSLIQRGTHVHQDRRSINLDDRAAVGELLE